MRILKSLSLTEQTIDGEAVIHLWLLSSVLVVVMEVEEQVGVEVIYAYADSLLKGSTD